MIKSPNTLMSEASPTLKERIKGFKLPNKPSKKNMFWAWVTYQAIKGTLTTTFIWIPALIYWLQH